MSEGERDRNLVGQAVAGDRPALEELLLIHYDRLGRRIRRKLPVTMRAVVSEEDILQQAFADVFCQVSTFEPRGPRSFFFWLATIADHRLQDAIKRHQAAKRGGGRAGADPRSAFGSESMDELISLMAGPDHTASRSVARHEAVAAVRAGLASLGNECRQAIELRYIQGVSVAEAAEVMGKPPRMVRGLCYRGLAELRVLMGSSSQFFTKT